MSIEYYSGKRPVDWKCLSLERFVRRYCPEGWEPVFEAASEIIPEISREIRKQAREHIIYPPMPDVFLALEMLKPTDIKVVIIGMDPYINSGQAMGLSFSVPPNIKLPPSLRNIYKELTAEGYEGYAERKSGDLTFWVRRGVFLYNACLTVNKGESGSHKHPQDSKKGLWNDFSDMVINHIKNQKHVAWILLGKNAQQFAGSIDTSNHGLFKAAHPSPKSADRGFFGSDVFSDAETYLNEHGRDFTWKLN